MLKGLAASFMLASVVSCGGGGSAPASPVAPAVTLPPAPEPRLTVEERMPGNIFSTFASHQPAFAGDYKSYTVDDRIGNFREYPVDIRIAHRTSGAWLTIWSRTADSDPACLVEDNGVVWGAVSDFKTGGLSVLSIMGDTVRVYESPDPFPTAAKNNCEVFNGELVIAGTYGNLARFSLASKTFLAQQQVIANNYEGEAWTQYPHISKMGDRLFVGWNTVPDAKTWRFYDLIGYIDDVSAPKPFVKMLPDDLKDANTWIADTWSDGQSLYFAGTANDYKINTEYFADFATGLSGNIAFFGSCDMLLACTIQRTTERQDFSGNFVRRGAETYFIGGAPDRINIWRLEGGQFVLLGFVKHDLKCAYQWNFAPVAEGNSINGQVTEAPSWCDPSLGTIDETYVGFKLTLN